MADYHNKYAYYLLFFTLLFQHELLLFHKPVIMTCQQLLSIEQLGSHWSLGVPLQPPPHVSPPSPPLSSPPSPPTQSCSASTELLYCNETMVPVGGFHDGTGVSPASSPVISRCPNSIDSAYRLVIFSYAAYCRYRAVLKRFQPDPYSYMRNPLVQAMGGVSVPATPTIALFCRKTFRDGTLERKLMTMEGKKTYTHTHTCKLLITEQNCKYYENSKFLVMVLFRQCLCLDSVSISK